MDFVLKAFLSAKTRFGRDVITEQLDLDKWQCDALSMELAAVGSKSSAKYEIIKSTKS